MYILIIWLHLHVKAEFALSEFASLLQASQRNTLNDVTAIT